MSKFIVQSLTFLLFFIGFFSFLVYSAYLENDTTKKYTSCYDRYSNVIEGQSCKNKYYNNDALIIAYCALFSFMLAGLLTFFSIFSNMGRYYE